MQDQDLFEDILEIKNECKLASIKNIKSNLIDIKDFIRDLQK